MRKLILITLLTLSFPFHASSEAVSVKCDNIILVPGQPALAGYLTIKDGIAVEVTSAPANDAKVVDATKGFITPGLIDSVTRYGLSEVGAEDSTVEGSFKKDTIAAAFDVSLGLYRDSVRFPMLRKRGVTTVISHPSGGLVAGQSAAYFTSTPAMPVKTKMAMVASIKKSAGAGSTGWAMHRLTELVNDSKILSSRKSAYDKGETRQLSSSKSNLEAINTSISSSHPWFVKVDSYSSIVALVELSKKLGIKLVVVGGKEAWKAAGLLAKEQIPVVLNPADNLPDSFSAIRMNPNAAGVLQKAGVPLIISTTGNEPYLGQLTQAVALAIRSGLEKTAALQAVTTTPAKVFGLPGGTIKLGKPATLVVWSADPFTFAAAPLAVFIDGNKQPLQTRHDALMQRYRNL